jgi:hypothetical protein
VRLRRYFAARVGFFFELFEPIFEVIAAAVSRDFAEHTAEAERQEQPANPYD